METFIRNIYEDSNALVKAGELIRSGELVAFPTETVFGLGGDAMNPDASRKIYEAKGRPSDNPLIVHICDIEQVFDIAEDISDTAMRLMKHFMPGPITVILKKKPCVPKATTGGLDTVAVRMPSHKVAAAFIRESKRLIAAPSANLSGRPSPTTAAHVYEDLKGRIPLILDGDNVDIGIESTIVDMTTKIPMILRPGFITAAMIEEITGTVSIDPAVSSRTKPENIIAKAPGMKYRHYAPVGKLTIVNGKEDAVRLEMLRLAGEKLDDGYRTGILCPLSQKEYYQNALSGIHVIPLGRDNSADSIAAALYSALRLCDDMKLDHIYCQSFFDNGLGDSVMNRLLKASGYEMLNV